jgi:hypothetical protein
MAIRVDKEARKRIDAKKIDMKKENYIYVGNVYRTLIDDKYCDVSGIKLDKPKEIDYISICKRLERIEDKLDYLIKRYDNN